MPEHPAAAPAKSTAGTPKRAVRQRVYGQNFLIDRRAIEGLVAGSGVGEGDLVLDVGAGNGLITEAVARRRARVVAIERDPALARRLRARFGPGQGVEAGPGPEVNAEPGPEVNTEPGPGMKAGRSPGVTVVEGDALTTPLPREPFQVVANIPFGITTKILRRLLGDPSGMLRRADVIVQAEVARKRGTPGRGTLLNACWEPWFEFGVGQRIPRAAFRPQPRVDAAVLIARRRRDPLLDPAVQREYTDFVTRAFTDSHPTVASALSQAIGRTRFAALAAELGFGAGALPGQLDVGQWAGLFQATRWLHAGGRRPRPPGS